MERPGTGGQAHQSKSLKKCFCLFEVEDESFRCSGTVVRGGGGGQMQQANAEQCALQGEAQHSLLSLRSNNTGEIGLQLSLRENS